MIIHEFLKNIKRFKLIRIISILILSFCFFSLNMLLSNLTEVKLINNYMTTSSNSQNGLKLVDSMDETKTLSIFFKDLNRLNDLKSFSYELNSSIEFDYSAIYQNPVNVLYNANIPMQMYAYEDKSFTTINGYDMLTVNAVQISNKTNEFFPLKISEGRQLEPSDYIFNDRKINILLGANYKERFNIGENLKLEYWGLIFDAQIVGFLDENSFIMEQNNPIYLENYIVVPFLSCPNNPIDDNEVIFQGISYTSFINGIAFIKDNYEIVDVTSRIDLLCRKYDIPAFGYEGINSNSIRFLNYVLQLGMSKLNIFAIMIYVISCASFVLIELYIYSKNVGGYFIHMLNGASKITIALYSTMDILFQFMMSLVIAVLIYSFAINSFYFNWIFILLSFPILIITLLILYYKVYCYQNFNINMEEDE